MALSARHLLLAKSDFQFFVEVLCLAPLIVPREHPMRTLLFRPIRCNSVMKVLFLVKQALLLALFPFDHQPKGRVGLFHAVDGFCKFIPASGSRLFPFSFGYVLDGLLDRRILGRRDRPKHIVGFQFVDELRLISGAVSPGTPYPFALGHTLFTLPIKSDMAGGR